jgi:hypothetical protein
MILLSDATRTTAAVLLFSLVTVETGGMYLVRLVRGSAAATPFQLAFARAGHAHAAVLLVLSLVCLLLADAAAVTGVAGQAGRWLVPASALLMPGGFFFSSLGNGRTSPNRFIALLWAGAASLAAGLTALGIALVQAG